jgi:hypothetical protein
MAISSLIRRKAIINSVAGLATTKTLTRARHESCAVGRTQPRPQKSKPSSDAGCWYQERFRTHLLWIEQCPFRKARRTAGIIYGLIKNIYKSPAGPALQNAGLPCPTPDWMVVERRSFHG